MKSRILASVLAAIISSIAIILLYKYSSTENSDVIFILITSQQIAGLITIFLLYGAQFELKEKVIISAWKIIIFSVFIIPFVPLLSVTCLLLTRISIQKFGKIQFSNNFLKLIIILLYILILYYLNSNWLLLLVAFTPLIPLLLVGESAFEVPKFLLIKKNNTLAILSRSSIDLALLVPMIIINFLTNYYFLANEYVEIQKLIFCLSGLAIATTILEKIIFDKSLTESYNLKIVRYNTIFLLITYVGVFILAYFISIKEDYWWYLVITPAINLLFTNTLSRMRPYLIIKDCLTISFRFVFATLFFVIFAIILIRNGLNPVNSVIMSMTGLSLFQLVILNFSRK